MILFRHTNSNHDCIQRQVNALQLICDYHCHTHIIYIIIRAHTHTHSTLIGVHEMHGQVLWIVDQLLFLFSSICEGLGSVQVQW